MDDFFPALETSQVDDDNKGLAVGHSYGARELWVSLLEKVSEERGDRPSRGEWPCTWQMESMSYSHGTHEIECSAAGAVVDVVVVDE